jgi:hypothetical protein
MVIVAGKTVDFQGIAGFLMGLKPDMISINRDQGDIWFLTGDICKILFVSSPQHIVHPQI